MEDETPTRKSSTTLTYNDPGRTFDGNPYEAAGQTVVQTDNVLKLAQVAVHDTEIQARNAFMQRNLDTDGAPNAEAWEDAPERKLLAGIAEVISKARKRLSALHKAVTFDPNEPIPKED